MIDHRSVSKIMEAFGLSRHEATMLCYAMQETAWRQRVDKLLSEITALVA